MVNYIIGNQMLVMFRIFDGSSIINIIYIIYIIYVHAGLRIWPDPSVLIRSGFFFKVRSDPDLNFKI